MAICNVATSSLVRESDLTLLTQAGPEIGVASTKAFTTQLVALLLLTLGIGQVQKRLADGVEAELVDELRRLPTRLGEALAMNRTVEKVSGCSPRSTTPCSSAVARSSRWPWKAR